MQGSIKLVVRTPRNRRFVANAGMHTAIVNGTKTDANLSDFDFTQTSLPSLLMKLSKNLAGSYISPCYNTILPSFVAIQAQIIETSSTNIRQPALFVRTHSSDFDYT